MSFDCTEGMLAPAGCLHFFGVRFFGWAVFVSFPFKERTLFAGIISADHRDFNKR